MSKTGDTLERLNAVIDGEIFRSLLERINAKDRKTAAGRRPTCRVLMFKLLILLRLHNLSDERLQYKVSDRLSFMRFLGLELSGNVPDAHTAWAFREAIKEHRLVEPLFEYLNQALADLGVELKSGQIIDATFVPVSIQRNGCENNVIIKADDRESHQRDLFEAIEKKTFRAGRCMCKSCRKKMPPRCLTIPSTSPKSGRKRITCHQRM